MSSFDDEFDARLWVQEHGPPPERGCSLSVTFSTEDLDESVQIPSCASWDVPELGIGQGLGGQHAGFRGTLGMLLAKARSDAERNRGLYGESARPKFDELLHALDSMLGGEGGLCTLDVRDPSGLCSFGGALEARTRGFPSWVRSADEEAELGLSAPLPKVERQFTTAAEIAALVRRSTRVAALTGAGISVESGIRPFRDPATERAAKEELLPFSDDWQIAADALLAASGVSRSDEGHRFTVSDANGEVVALFQGNEAPEPARFPLKVFFKGSIWGTFDAARMTVTNFNSSEAVREASWEMHRSIISEVALGAPNPAHAFFGLLERQGKLGMVITQNIDSYHLKVGVPTEKIIELHGHLRGMICASRHTPLNPIPFGGRGDCSYEMPEAEVLSLAASWQPGDSLPPCPLCGAPLRSPTVMFEQPLPAGAMDAARDAVDAADLLFVIGSTLIVKPASELPLVALRKGVPVVIINLDGTQYDAHATGLVKGKAGEFLATVAKELESSVGDPPPAAPPHEAPPRQKERQSANEVRLTRVAREGRVRGKEVACNAKACGLSHYCTVLVEPEDSLEQLVHALGAMHEETPDIGKLVLSAGASRLVLAACAPSEPAVDCRDWLGHVVAALGSGEVLLETSTAGSAQAVTAVVPADPRRDAFPLKLRDPGVMAGIAFLKARGHWCADDDDDEDYIFSLDDIPDS